jgi:hypothetical protein
MAPGQAIARAASRRVSPAPGDAADHARALEARYGRAEAARRAGVSARTWRRWKAGGRPSRANADRLAREARISPRREARLRRLGAYVQMSGRIGGGTPGAGRKHTRHRTIGARGFDSVHLSGEEMTKILDAWEAGDDQAALEALQEAMADAYGFPDLTFEDLTQLEFLRDDPNRERR